MYYSNEHYCIPPCLTWLGTSSAVGLTSDILLPHEGDVGVHRAGTSHPQGLGAAGLGVVGLPHAGVVAGLYVEEASGLLWVGQPLPVMGHNVRLIQRGNSTTQTLLVSLSAPSLSHHVAAIINIFHSKLLLLFFNVWY